VSEQTSPPRETLVRAVRPGLEFRAATEEDDLGEGYLGLLRVLFSPVNEWTEINSMWEGRFMERFAPGAWKKTIREQANRVRSLFQHGADPQVGDKPLGPIRNLVEGEQGGYGEVALLDTSYNRDLLPGLKDGLYGASHRFSVMREEEVSTPEPSDHNPNGLPERTIKEAQLFEFGPVTFPAYAGATAGMRSMTDDFLMRCFERDPDRLRDMFERATDLRAEEPTEVQDEEQDTQDAPSEGDAGTESHLTDERRETAPPVKAREPIYGQRRKETSKPWLLGRSKSTRKS
jgi:HK97 family phage prohead protease